MSGGKFELISGSLCLNFANTVHNAGARDPGDDLSDYKDLLSWAEQSRILSRSAARDLVSRRNAADPSFLAYAKRTRETIYAIFSAIAAAEKPPARALGGLNLLLREAMPHLSLSCSGADFTWRWGGERVSPRFILWNVAYSAASLLTSDDLRRVRECNGPTCTWLFLDRSKNGTRRWCDMKNCGNREKSRRHYARVKRSGR